MSQNIEVSSGNYVLPTQPDTDDFGLNASFDRWCRDVFGLDGVLMETEPSEDAESDIYIGSFPGSNCEVTFEGILHFDGYSIGNISSPEGTLVLTRRGRIEADINVGSAIINGAVTGDIRATERVVLESHAKVTGQIYTPAITIRLGAIFDGDCVLTAPPAAKKSTQWMSHTEEEDELLVAV